MYNMKVIIGQLHLRWFLTLRGSYTSIEYYYANFYSTGVRVSDHWVYTGLAVRLVTNVE